MLSRLCCLIFLFLGCLACVAKSNTRSCWEKEPIVIAPGGTYSFFLRPPTESCFWGSQQYALGHFSIQSPFAEDRLRVEAGYQYCDTTGLNGFRICESWTFPPSGEPRQGAWNGLVCMGWPTFFGRTSITCINHENRNCQLLATVCMEDRPRPTHDTNQTTI